MKEQDLNIQAPEEIYTQDPEPERACRVCGCYELDACQHDLHGNCWWVEADLCSHCLYWPGEGIRYSLINAEAAAEGAFCD